MSLPVHDLRDRHILSETEILWQTQAADANELSLQLTEITHRLRDISSYDWSERVKQMQLMRELIAQHHSGPHRKLIMHYVQQSAYGIRTQIGDVRSSVVVEACSLVTGMIHLLRADAEYITLICLPLLLKSSAIPSSVVARASIRAVRAAIEVVRAEAFIPIVVGFVYDRSSSIRMRAAQHLSYITATFAPKEMELYNADIESAIYQSGEDMKDATRASARRCYLNYLKHFPERAKSLRKRLGPRLLHILNIEDYVYADDYFSEDEMQKGRKSTPQKQMASKGVHSPKESSSRPSSAPKSRPPSNNIAHVSFPIPDGKIQFAQKKIPQTLAKTKRPTSGTNIQPPSQETEKLQTETVRSIQNDCHQPPYSVYEAEDRIIIAIDLPGVLLVDVSYEIHRLSYPDSNKALVVTASRNPDMTPDGSVCHHESRPLGRSQLRIQLPRHTLVDGNIETSLSNGIYRIELASSRNPRPQQAWS